MGEVEFIAKTKELVRYTAESLGQTPMPFHDRGDQTPPVVVPPDTAQTDETTEKEKEKDKEKTEK